MMNRIFIGAMLTITLGFPQIEPMYLSLQDCIEIGQEQSPDAISAWLMYESETWKYNAHVASLLPQVSLGATLPNLTRALTEADTAVWTSDSDLSLSLTQSIPQTGASLWLSSSLNRFDSWDPDHGYFWQANPIELGLTQPIFQYNAIGWQNKQKILEYELMKRQFLERLEANRINITQAFFDLYVADILLETAEFNSAVNDTIFNISKGRYEVGKIAENDLLRTELAVMDAQNALEQSRLNYLQAYQNLKIVLSIADDDSLVILPPDPLEDVDVLPDDVLHLSRSNSSEYIQYELQLLAAERAVSQSRWDNFISADVSTSIGYNYGKTSENVPDLYGDPLDQQNFTLSLDIPITHGIRKSNLASARLNRDRAEIEVENERRKYEQQLDIQVREFKLLKSQLFISARADTIATSQFNVAKNRYLIGKIDITNLFNAQREKDAARRSYFITLKNYWMKYYQIRQSALFDFVREEPIQIP